ncbi:MAG: heparinase II/III-family protein [Nitrospirae bacterium]|nr:heparinase II/III-family protein [Candidatus Manganitrophaceae bacterium]
MTVVSQVALKARTAYALGLPNIFRVTVYRLSLFFGLNAVRRLKARSLKAPFFNPMLVATKAIPPIAWQDQAYLFGWFPVVWTGEVCPDWHKNQISGSRAAGQDRPWWEIPDFDPKVGDIKAVWEASRFDWVLAMAQRAAAGEASEWVRLNAWLEDWCQANPTYLGPNWKCGQEASIRVMHLAMAALISDQAEKPCESLLDLVEAHLLRIAPTVRYAMAQDNNHGTSEAAALFIGGSWLVRSGRSGAEHWEELGRYWLENRAGRLIEPDGSFSQYSVNYHRFLLDTFSMVEVWRRHAVLKPFSSMWQARAAAAARWLAAFVDLDSGDAPNLGANDGARLLPLTDTDFRDFRPSVQLAMVLFTESRVYPAEGIWNVPLRWLGVSLPEAVAETTPSRLFNDGGYARLRRGRAMALLRYPRFRFRPSQADALHLDLWVSGENLLRDAGSFSYNTDEHWINYFSGTSGHNTVQFDDHDQMPRLSLFLFGDWLETRELVPLEKTDQAVSCGAGYRDRFGVAHSRKVRLESNALIVRDEICGFKRKAVLRWRLRPGSWKVEGNVATDGKHAISVKANVPMIHFNLIQGWESRYYLQKAPVPVLEVEVSEPGVLTTEYRWLS